MTAPPSNYSLMRDAILSILPAEPPGMTLAEILDAVEPLLPKEQFPDRKTLAWYARTVPNDLVVRGLADYIPGARPPRLRPARNHSPLLQREGQGVVPSAVLSPSKCLSKGSKRARSRPTPETLRGHCARLATHHGGLLNRPLAVCDAQPEERMG